MYNDKSPLEMHHASMSFQLLQEDELNFLEKAQKSDIKSYRERVIKSILGTDMSVHFGDLGKLKGRISSQGNFY